MSKSPVYPIHGRHAVAPPSLLGRLYGLIQGWILQVTAVNELENLTDRQLRDVGIERRQIEQVARREIARLQAK